MGYAALAAAMLAVTACASVKKPATLTQAEALNQVLREQGAERRAEAPLIRSREALVAAQNALAAKESQEYVEGLSHVALRLAQVADAENARVLANNATDSLKRETLRRQLARSEALRARGEAQNAQQQQMSQAQIDSLQRHNAMIQQQSDSLRRAAEAANQQLNNALSQLRNLVTEITNLRETSRGIVISLSDILFDVNRATLKPGAESNVRRIAAILQQYPDRQIAVEGHTDATGSDAYNQTLSEDRAASVRASLVAGGVPEGQITSRGFGKTQPVATNDNPAGRQQNRRVEIIVLGAGKLADAVPPSGAAPPPPPRKYLQGKIFQ
jgi:outer membrane protein OmpA-like peptidoglycan-associated protein